MQIEVMIIGIQVEIVDKMPLIAKVIIIPGVIFLIWVILISFGFVSESVSDWISNVIDFLLVLGTGAIYMGCC